MPSVSKATLDFLNNLKENNHRDWMTDNKKPICLVRTH